MAKCALDLENPKFQIIGNASDAALQQGLIELRTKLANDYKLSGFFCQPMKHFPAYQRRVWKWDFSPPGEASSTRKGWRLYAWVPNPDAPEPIPAHAFVCYDKQNDPGNYVQFLAKHLKRFLSLTVEVRPEEEKFKRSNDPDGSIRSICYTCFDTVAVSQDFSEVEVLESSHDCPGQPNW